MIAPKFKQIDILWETTEDFSKSNHLMGVKFVPKPDTAKSSFLGEKKNFQNQLFGARKKFQVHGRPDSTRVENFRKVLRRVKEAQLSLPNILFKCCLKLIMKCFQFQISYNKFHRKVMNIFLVYTTLLYTYSRLKQNNHKKVRQIQYRHRISIRCWPELYRTDCSWMCCPCRRIGAIESIGGYGFGKWRRNPCKSRINELRTLVKLSTITFT